MNEAWIFYKKRQEIHQFGWKYTDIIVWKVKLCKSSHIFYTLQESIIEQ